MKFVSNLRKKCLFCDKSAVALVRTDFLCKKHWQLFKQRQLYSDQQEVKPKKKTSKKYRTLRFSLDKILKENHCKKLSLDKLGGVNADAL